MDDAEPGVTAKIAACIKAFFLTGKALPTNDPFVIFGR